MFGSGVVGAVVLCSLFVGAACGGASEPRDQDIWHSSNLRPGRVEPESEGERELLARLDDVPSNQAVTFGGQSFVVDEPYASASGRVCRSVTVRGAASSEQALDVKLACQEDGGWVFVPDVFEDRAMAAGGGR